MPVAMAMSVMAAPAVAHADTVWLCRPGASPNPCKSSLKTTVRTEGKAAKVVKPKAVKKPKFDCFYVYPTVSEQPNVVANLDIDPAEVSIAQQQAARFSQVCKVYAPMYRQITLRAILGGAGQATPEERELGYSDVLAAWQEYRAANAGRGFILIGHSQGSGVLKRLIREQIEPDPVARQEMVSALITGSSVAVPKGKTVGGDFSQIPICTRPKQTGCIISYATFSQTPPENSLFGRVRFVPGGPLQEGVEYEAACTNPAALKGGSAELDTILRTTPVPGLLGGAASILWGGKVPSAKTDWLKPSSRYKGKCVTSNGANVLRVKGIGDARKLTGSPNPTWGLHLVDINIVLGDLIDVVRSQQKAYSAR